jgi:hypothetical protein
LEYLQKRSLWRFWRYFWKSDNLLTLRFLNFFFG